MLFSLSLSRLLCLLAITACLVVVVVEGKVSQGRIDAFGFAYVDKFCYGYGEGTLSIKARTLNRVASVYVLCYDDEGDNWQRAHTQSSLSCEERMHLAKPPYLDIGTNISKTFTVLDIARPHYWFVALMACDHDIQVDYELEFIQSSNNEWERQFSYDEIGLPQLFIVFFVFYTIGAAIHAVTAYKLYQASSYHSIVKLLTITIGLGWISALFLFCHYVQYSKNGVGVPALRSMGELADMLAQVVFMLLLILIAKGWCISTTHIQQKWAVLGALLATVLTYLGMFIWESVGLDPASILYVYQTPPGIVIIVVRCLAMVLFAFSIYRTYTTENDAHKQKFYLVFGILYLAWFLSLPFVTSIAAVINPWMRLKVVTSLYVTLNALFVFGLGYVFWPSVVSEYFKVSSVDISASPYEAI